MGNNTKRIFGRIVSLLLCLILLLPSAACGKEKTSTTSVSESTEVSASTETSVSVEEPEAPAKITDNGRPIWDYDEFVNAEWKKSKEEESGDCIYAMYDSSKDYRARITDILENTDISTLSEDDDLYKAIVLYREIADYSDIDERIDTFKKYLEPISKIKDLNSLYEFCAKQENIPNNLLLAFEVNTDDNGYYSLFYLPQDLSEMLKEYLAMVEAGEDNPSGQYLLAYYEKLGYSAKRTKEMFANASVVADMIHEYLNNPEDNGSYYYFTQAKLDRAEVSIKILDILKAQGMEANTDSFLAKKHLPAFWNELFQSKNVKAIRDYLLVGAISTYCSATIYDATEAGAESYRDFAYYMATRFATGAIVKEYRARYFDEKALADIGAMAQEIKEETKKLVGNIEWLGNASKETVTRKVWTMRMILGGNEIYNGLSDVALTGNVIDDLYALTIDRFKFNYAQTLTEDDARKLFKTDTLDINGWFYAHLNAVTMTLGQLDHTARATMSYEELLAHFGECFAHEMAHTYDPESIYFTAHGLYEPWMKEEESQAYSERIASIAEFFDGYETLYGEKISGDTVKKEAFADLMALKVCLNLLEKRDNPDYDLFFRTLAADKAAYYTETGMKTALADSHLPGKERINCIFGQFDKFYEVYDIDENSPYYIPKDKRIKFFWE